MPTLHWVGKDKVVNHHHDVPFRLLNKEYTFTAQHSTAQHSTAQHSTAQHSTAQHSTAQQLYQNSTDNRIIHGDNLEALKSLLPEFEGKINCIYIDPPYNTGMEEWQYNDNVNDPKIKKWLGQVVGKEGEDLSRHDKWLCMMYPRIKLLHKLLNESGTIFISIDDNEQAHLKVLLDEIFGVNKFVTTLHVQMSSVQGQKVASAKKGNIVKNAEYVLVYNKSGKNSIAQNILYEATDYDTHYSIYLKPDGDLYREQSLSSFILENKSIRKIVESFGFLKSNSISNKNIALLYKVNQEFRNFIHENSNNIASDDKTGDISLPESLSLTVGEVIQVTTESREYLITINSNGNIRQRMLLSEKINQAHDFWETYGTTTIRGDWWSEFNKDMGNVSKEGNTVFANAKKPVRLIEQILYTQALGKDAIILDSFAGSGTTAHAVLKLNATDGGNRRFILCEMMDYAETITAERVRRVMNGYGEGTKAVAGLGGGFDYYTVGEPLFLPDKNLNESVGAEAIRAYVAYTESIPSEQQADTNYPVSPYALGVGQRCLWVFYYEREQVTTLDMDFLASLNIKALQSDGQVGQERPETFVIYADKCTLSPEFMAQHGIVFKRIPRDITRF